MNQNGNIACAALCDSEYNAELAGVLKAISVVAIRLAQKLERLDSRQPGGGENNAGE